MTAKSIRVYYVCVYMLMINVKCVKSPAVLLETNTTGRKIPKCFLSARVHVGERGEGHQGT